MNKTAAGSLILAFAVIFSGCGAGSPQNTEKDDDSVITIGFSQVGEESDWRRANSESIEETFSAKNGYHLLFDDAQNRPENQITALRNFIQQEVDYIVLEPIVEQGWETVLTEAKEAGIPVIVADRSISVEDESLFTAWVGSDMLLEGRKTSEWLHSFIQAKGIDDSEVRLVNIQGTLGSTPQIGRAQGMREAAKKYGWTLLGSARGEFTTAKGREAMESLLERFDDINVVFCDNDNEAYGAIDAIEKAGRKAGTDIANGEILIISYDAASKGLQLVLDGKIACDGDCNPLHGPRIRDIIENLEAGKEVGKYWYVEEELYAGDDTVRSVMIDDTEYPVTVVTEELIAERKY